MAKQRGIMLPSGQGGLIGGFNSTLKTKFEFGPKVVIYFSLAVVIFILIMFNLK